MMTYALFRSQKVHMKKRRRALVVWLLLCLLGGYGMQPGDLLASCGTASCPLETSVASERHPSSGELRLHFSHEFIDADDIFISTRRARVGELPRHHDERFTVNHSWNLSLDYGLAPRFTVGLRLPFSERYHRHISRGHEEQGMGKGEAIGGGLFEGGSEVETGLGEHWRYRQLGDIQLLGRYLLIPPSSPQSPALTLFAGLKLPTGRTGVENGSGEKAEITMQPGSGSVDPLLGFSYLQHFEVPTPQGETAYLPLFVSVLGRINGSAGRYGYRPGDEVLVNLGTSYPLSQRVDLLAQVNYRYRGRDDAGHAPGLEAEDTGGESLMVSPGLRFHLTEALSAYAYAQLPVYRRVHGIQTTADWSVLTGINYRFDLLRFLRREEPRI